MCFPFAGLLLMLLCMWNVIERKEINLHVKHVRSSSKGPYQAAQTAAVNQSCFDMKLRRYTKTRIHTYIL